MSDTSAAPGLAPGMTLDEIRAARAAKATPPKLSPGMTLDEIRAARAQSPVAAPAAAPATPKASPSFDTPEEQAFRAEQGSRFDQSFPTEAPRNRGSNRTHLGTPNVDPMGDAARDFQQRALQDQTEYLASQGFRQKGGGAEPEYVQMTAPEMAISAPLQHIRKGMQAGVDRTTAGYEKGDWVDTARGGIQTGVGAITVPFAPGAAALEITQDPKYNANFGEKALEYAFRAPALPFELTGKLKQEIDETAQAYRDDGSPNAGRLGDYLGLGVDVGELVLGAKMGKAGEMIEAPLRRGMAELRGRQALARQSGPLAPDAYAMAVARAKAGVNKLRPVGDPLGNLPVDTQIRHRAAPEGIDLGGPGVQESGGRLSVKPNPLGTEGTGPSGASIPTVEATIPRNRGRVQVDSLDAAREMAAGVPGSRVVIEEISGGKTYGGTDAYFVESPRGPANIKGAAPAEPYNQELPPTWQEKVNARRGPKMDPYPPPPAPKAAVATAAPEIAPRVAPPPSAAPELLPPKSKFLLDYEKAREMVRPPVPAEAPPVAPAPRSGVDPVAPPAPSPPPARGSGSTMRRPGQSGGIDLAAVRDVARKGEGLLDRADELASRGTKPVVDAALDKIPGARYLEHKVLRTEEGAISPEFEQTIRAGESLGRDLQYESNVAMTNLHKATRGLPETVMDEIGKSLSSEPANLAMVPAEVIPLMEAVRSANQTLRGKMVEAGAMKPQTFAEYPQGHLARVLKPDTLKQRFQNWRGGVKLDETFVARDMPSVNPKMTEAEVRALIPEGAPVRVINPDGGRTLVKFDNTPEGLAARDALVTAIKEKFGGARADLGALASSEIRAGDVRQSKMLVKAQADIPTAADLDIRVRQSKMLVKAQADIPTAADLDIRSMDPIPPDVAKRIFISDPVARAKVTTEAGARAVATRNTQEALSVLRDKDGPIAIEPADRGAAARGIETPPAGYEVLAGEQYGTLNGMFVRENAAKYIKGAYTPEATNFGKSFGKAIMSDFKAAVLLAAPRQWFRQFVSNFESENLAGMSFWNPRWVQHKSRGLAAMREGSKYHRELLAEGFLEPSFVTAEELGIMGSRFRSANDPGARVGHALGTFGISEVAPGPLNSAKGKLARGFAVADAWTKASIYALAREEMGMSHKQAAAYTRKWTHDANQASPFSKYWSTNILGNPWARFLANQARINLDGLREKPIRLAINIFQTTIMKWSLAALGIVMLSDDEDEAIKNEQGGGALAVGRDEQLRPVAIDYSFLGTTGDFDSRPKTIGKPGRDLREDALRLTGFGNNPFVQIANEVYSGRDKFGREVNKGGSVGGMVGAAGESFFGTFVPNLAKSGQGKIRAALEDKPYSPNQPKQTVPQSVLDVFFGFKLTPLDAQRAIEKIARQGEFAMADLRSEFNKDAALGRTIDEEEIRASANAIAEQFAKRAAPLTRLREQQAGRPVPLETVK